MRKHAFTLVEVLVVVGIIALLAAILLPSLARARRQSQATACLSNMRSLGLAVLMYAHDYKEHLVTAGFAHGGGLDAGAAWFHTLRRTYRNELVARCPVDASPYWREPPPGGAIPRKVSYGTNWYTVARVGSRGPYDRLGKFRRPATTIYIAEMAETGLYAASDHYHPEQWFSDPRRLASDQLALARHAGKANYTFIDGHAEGLFFERTYSIDLGRTSFPNMAWRHNLFDPNVAR